MATIVKSNAFVNGAAARADLVNQDFDEILDFANNKIAHLDGTKTYAVAPSIPTPTNHDHIINMTYAQRRPLFAGISNQYVSGIPAPATKGLLVKSGITTITGDSTGLSSVTFKNAFQYGIVTVIIQPWKSTYTADIEVAGPALTGFHTYSAAGVAIKISWIAIGR